MAQNIRVVIRFRPINSREKEEQAKLKIQDKPINIQKGKNNDVISICAASTNDPQTFSFDRIIQQCSQHEAFEAVGLPICLDALNGYNGTVFAYGQTGSGKTFSMLGDESDPSDPEKMGIIPLSISYVFTDISENENIKTATVKVSFCEIYKEKLRDLLNPSQKNLKIALQKNGDTRINNLTERVVTGLMDILKLLEIASANRTRAHTNMNATSSRSHMLITLTLTIKMKDDNVRIGRINFADLAGSEKVRKTGVTGNRLKEAQKINLSLTMLGQTISFLAEGKKHIPYRDSLLTHILKDSLGGNCKTCLLLCASPHMFNRDETINSLRFGSRCKMIKTKAKINKIYTNQELQEIVKKLKKENDRLKHGKGIKKQEKKFKHLQQETQMKIDDLEKEKIELETKRHDAMVKLEDYNRILTEKNDELEELNKENESLEKQNKEILLEIDNYKKEHSELTDLIKKLETELDENKKNILTTEVTQIRERNRSTISSENAIDSSSNNNYKKQFNQLNKKYETLQMKLETQIQKIAQLEDENDKLKDELDKRSHMINTNRSLTNPFDEYKIDDDSADEDDDIHKKQEKLDISDVPLMKLSTSDVSEHEIFDKNSIAYLHKQQSAAIAYEHKRALSEFGHYNNSPNDKLSKLKAPRNTLKVDHLFSNDKTLKQRQNYLMNITKQSRMRLHSNNEYTTHKQKYPNKLGINGLGPQQKQRITTELKPRVETLSEIESVNSRLFDDLDQYNDDHIGTSDEDNPDNDDKYDILKKQSTTIINNDNNTNKKRPWWSCFSCLGGTSHEIEINMDSKQKGVHHKLEYSDSSY